METSPLLEKPCSRSKQPPAWHDFVDLSSMAAQVSMATLARAALLAIDSVFLGHLGVKELAAASLAQLWTSPCLYAVWASASALNTLCGQSWGAGNRELTGIWLQFGLMITTLLSVPVTIWYCNYVLIYGIGSWHGLGFIGSPIATVVASWFQPIALFSYAIMYRKHHHRAWYGWNVHTLTLSRLRSFLRVAGPISSNSFVSNLANALVALVAARLGARVIAANAVISGLWALLWALFWGYGCATQVRVANYLGAGKPDLARRITGLGFICTMVVVVLIATVTSVMDQHIITLYTTDKELLTMCKLVLPMFVVACIFEAIEILGAGALTGMSQVHTVFWTSAIATWLINLPVAYVGGITLGYGFPALWVGVLSMELFKVGSYSLALAHVRWGDMAERVKEAAEAAPDMEQSTAQFVAAAADVQPTTPPTTPPLIASALDRHRRLRNEELHFNLALKSKVRPINGQSLKSREI
ncbi:Multidrug/Oligosaccharidyl-lipid/polysaccharide (MOP) Flippase Superfamily [Phytophthora cinnamomi]|uniref:Multidrug/Oligosaccharidyl-lipid/polysaccharide (MOP) Flippase Superfamily n=1 Tax=Phytophthora cinnamomi TaxID=4785 RepID=UPI00355A2E9F|nr:Multidrug/Oligosaccharidyl-lipid/polysaccharide (MOP) Flippase Superfamily [Phytophthora cinnamomi]